MMCTEDEDRTRSEEGKDSREDALVEVREVGPRDGFQAVRDFIPTETKIEIVNRLIETGLRSIQVTSFVDPRAIPQLADAEAVVQGIRKKPSLSISVLVANRRGAERALGSGVEEIDVTLSASESHSRANLNADVATAVKRMKDCIVFATQKGLRVKGGIAVAFGCPFEGEVPDKQIVEIISSYQEVGVSDVSLADTTGVANPKKVSRVLRLVRREFPNLRFGLHLHDTRGLALANVLAALEEGIRRFDSSVAGLGGCPYAPGASGNVSTEDLVHMLETMGFVTGVDLEKLLAVARYVEEVVGRSESHVLRAGPSWKFAGRFEGAQRKLAPSC